MLCNLLGKTLLDELKANIDDYWKGEIENKNLFEIYKVTNKKKQ